MRPIRSFVLRQGRFTPAQQRAFESLWPQYGIPFQGCVRDFIPLFSRTAPLVCEIGFGNGQALLHGARIDPQRNYIGIEVHAPGVGRLLNDLAREAYTNVRVYHHDAVAVLQHEFADASLSEVRIFFPDPWHKKRHTKRRLIQPEFAALLAKKLHSGGRLHIASDWEQYVTHIWDVMENMPEFVNSYGPRAHTTRPVWRPITHFEKRGHALGHGVWDLIYHRN